MKITKVEINRINELALKEKKEGLTPKEKAEQQMLRKAYIKAFKENLKIQLDSITILDAIHNLDEEELDELEEKEN